MTKSKRQIERRINEIDTGHAGEYPKLNNLSLALGYEWERLDPENNLYRREDSGEVYHMPPEFMNQIERIVDENEISP